MGARPIKPQDRDLICPLCLEQLTSPRLLTCLHTFCTKCLNSHIMNTAAKASDVLSFCCPVCRTNIRPPFCDKPVTEWTEQFLVDAILDSMLPGNQSNVDGKCEPCSVQGNNVVAVYFCTACKEGLCQNCYQYHKSSKISKDHNILMLKDIFADPGKAVILAEKLNCTVHGNMEYEFFCSDHGEICCWTCLVEMHKECENYKELKTHIEDDIKKNRPDEILEKMKQLEKHLVNISKTKKQNMFDLEADIKKNLSEISTLRLKLKTFLDKLERCVTEDCARVLKEQSIKAFDENQKLQSLLAAIKNSHKLLETLSIHGSEIQVYTVLHRMDYQLLHYQKQAVDCSNTVQVNVSLNVPTSLHEIITQVEAAPLSITVTEESIIDVPLETELLSANQETSKQENQPDEGNSVSHTSNVITRNPRQVSSDNRSNTRDIMKIKEMKVPGPNNAKMPGYCGIVCLEDNRVLLLDMYNHRCSLYDSNFHFIVDYTFNSEPARLCIVKTDEVAVSFLEKKKIEILYVNKTIKPKRSFSTKHICRGIAAVSSDELVVSGPLNDDKYYWGVVNMKGTINSSFYIAREDKTVGPGTSVALNSSKTRVYIACAGNNAVYHFDLNGKKYFEYKHRNLTRPSDIIIDSGDNLCVLGVYLSNIHYLSPTGSVLQVISSGIPRKPWALCLNQSCNKLFITIDNDTSGGKCYIYQLK